MANPVNNTVFGGDNPNTVSKTDAAALEAWNPLEILKAGDLNGFIQWVQNFARMVNNELANALIAFDITPNASLMNQLATLLQAQDAKIAAAAASGSLIGSYWFGLTGNVPGFVVPNPTNTSQNYYDFTTNTPYTAKSDLSGWDAGTPLTPPTDRDARIAITGKFWDIQETNNQGGFAFWSYSTLSWIGFAPTVIDWNNVNLTGIPTAPTPAAGAPGNQIATKDYVDSGVGGIGQVRPGMIVAYAGDIVAMGGYLLCDGAAVSRTVFSALFAAIGTRYGAGDGSTTFNLPDYRNAKYVSGGTYTVAIWGNGKTAIFTNGTQKGALRQGGSAINPCTAAPTSQTLPATNSQSSQFSGYTLLGFSTNSSQVGLASNVTIPVVQSPAFLIKY